MNPHCHRANVQAPHWQHPRFVLNLSYWRLLVAALFTALHGLHWVAAQKNGFHLGLDRLSRMGLLNKLPAQSVGRGKQWSTFPLFMISAIFSVVVGRFTPRMSVTLNEGNCESLQAVIAISMYLLLYRLVMMLIIHCSNPEYCFIDPLCLFSCQIRHENKIHYLYKKLSSKSRWLLFTIFISS